MRGKSLVVGSEVQLDDAVADLISRGYELMHQTPFRATLVRPRQGRFLAVVAVLFGILAIVLFVNAGSTGDDAAAPAAFTCLVIGGVTAILRNWYTAVRRDQVVHVLVRQQ